MIYLAFTTLVLIAIASPIAVAVYLTQSHAKENAYVLEQWGASVTAHLATLTAQVADKDATIQRQQETIEKTHTRLLLPMENAITDVRNQDEKLPATIQPQQIIPQEEYPAPGEFAATIPDLPYDLDVSPDDL
jgi:hypothetical protein